MYEDLFVKRIVSWEKGYAVCIKIQKNSLNKITKKKNIFNKSMDKLRNM